jgi:hypothetical protein
MSLSAYAWFFFPLTQNTSVYTDGVTQVNVAAYRYNRTTGSFGTAITPEGSPASITLDFCNNTGETISPYFFLWGGEYTSNDIYQTIYKVVVTYGNEAGAYPTRLLLYGDLNFDFWCLGDDGQKINIRFMKLAYFIPTAQTENGYLNTANYTAIDTAYYTSGCTLQLGGADVNPLIQAYTITFYLMLETDLAALNSQAVLLENEYGLLDAGYTIDASLYCRTAPANINTP